MKRLTPLTTGQVYHIYNKSIYRYTIFNSPDEYRRMLQLVRYYQMGAPMSFSLFLRTARYDANDFLGSLAALRPSDSRERVIILAFCLMPTHVHFILEQCCDGGIAQFMKDIQSGYSQYFNSRHNRSGPLWQGRFGNSLIKSESQLLEKTAYIHANPVQDLGCPSPKSWPYSSYLEFTTPAAQTMHLCRWEHRLPIRHQAYIDFMAHYLSTSRK